MQSIDNVQGLHSLVIHVYKVDRELAKYKQESLFTRRKELHQTCSLSPIARAAAFDSAAVLKISQAAVAELKVANLLVSACLRRVYRGSREKLWS